MDIGCNVGYFSIISSRYFSNVIAFEPHPITFHNFKRNITKNNIKSITAYNYAISDIEKEIILEENPVNVGGSKIIEKRENKNYVNSNLYISKSKTLDSILSNYSIPISLIKIDVEGHELVVLKGAKNVIQKHKPVIFIEIGKSKDYLVSIMSLLPPEYKYNDNMDLKTIEHVKESKTLKLDNDAILEYEK